MYRVPRLTMGPLALVLCFGLALVSGSPPAGAQFSVEETQTEKGEVEIEYNGAYFWGHPAFVPSDDDDDAPGMLENEVVRHGHEIEISGGVTERWNLGFGAELEEERGENGAFGELELTEIEIESRFEIISRDEGANGFGLAALLALGTSVAPGEKEQRQRLGALVDVVHGKFSAAANLFLDNVHDIREIEIEDGEVEIKRTRDHLDFAYGWQVKRQINRVLGLGVEGFGEIQDVNGKVPGPENPQQHRIGPVLFLTFAGSEETEQNGDDDQENHAEEEEGHVLNMAVGVLFGLNSDTADVALKWQMALEF